jgi:hypothetical protein
LAQEQAGEALNESELHRRVHEPSGLTSSDVDSGFFRPWP